MFFLQYNKFHIYRNLRVTKRDISQAMQIRNIKVQVSLHLRNKSVDLITIPYMYISVLFCHNQHIKILKKRKKALKTDMKSSLCVICEQ